MKLSKTLIADIKNKTLSNYESYIFIIYAQFECQLCDDKANSYWEKTCNLNFSVDTNRISKEGLRQKVFSEEGSRSRYLFKIWGRK